MRPMGKTMRENLFVIRVLGASNPKIRNRLIRQSIHQFFCPVERGKLSVIIHLR